MTAPVKKPSFAHIGGADILGPQCSFDCAAGLCLHILRPTVSASKRLSLDRTHDYLNCRDIISDNTKYTKQAYAWGSAIA
jgi:hypothetical protein